MNGVHEGLLILQADRHKFLFYNKPAKSILKKFVLWTDTLKEQDSIVRRPSFTQLRKD